MSASIRDADADEANKREYFMDKSEAKKISEVITKVLTKGLKKHGYDVKIEGGTFSSTSFTPCVIVTKAGVDVDKIKFARVADLFGLKPAHYGAKITSNGEEFKLIGLNPGRPKFPVSAERISDGKKFKLTESSLKQLNPNYGYRD